MSSKDTKSTLAIDTRSHAANATAPADAILGEQISHVLRQGTAGGVATLMVSSLYVLVMQNFSNSAALWIWYAILNIVGTIRIYLSRNWDKRALESWQPHGRIIVIAVGCASGVMWGAAATVLFPVGHPELYFIVAFLLIGMPAGALSSMGAWHPGYWSYLLGAVIPFIGWTLMSPDFYFKMTGVAAIIFAAFMMREGWATSNAFRRIIAQRDKLESLTVSLTQARDDAESANRAKSSFLANMSHEIRTPLNAVIGLSDLLAQNVVQPKNAEYVRIMRDSALSLLGIVNDVLDLSRIEAGRVDIRQDQFDLHDMLQELREMFLPAAHRKKIRLTIDIANDIPNQIVADATRLRQVLVNLIGNALKFTDEGDVAVMVTRSFISKADEKNEIALLLVEISDTGIGIPEASRTLLFKRFSQVDSTSARRFGGAGLGLRISSELIKMMGGDIGFSSVENEGSKFWFSVLIGLPAKSGDGIAVGTIANTANTAANTTTNTTSHAAATNATQTSQHTSPGNVTAELAAQFTRRVLVVEDNETNLMIAQKLLESLNCEVITAVSGLDGLAKLEASINQSVENNRAKSNIDLVFMDCQMAEMDGFEATREWRRREKNLGIHLPIVALTASAMVSDRQQCLDAGMDDHITKPFRRKDLQQALEQHNKMTN